MDDARTAEEMADRLLARVARADAAAFASVYDLYAGRVFSLALRIVGDARAAEDVTQEVFLAVWRDARNFERGRGSAASWVLSLAHHKAVDALRRMRVRATEPLNPALTVETDVAAEVIRTMEHGEVRRGLESLPPPQREAITLAYYGGYTQQELSRRLGVPLGTVKTRIRDGMIRLRSLVGRGRPETQEAEGGR